MRMRTAAALSVVAENPAPGALGVAERIRLLQQEARTLARDHIQALETALAQVERLSAEIADGGEAYPVGVREVARRLAEDCEASGNTLKAIASRA